MPAEIVLPSQLNPHSLPTPGGIIHQEFGPYRGLFQKHVKHTISLLDKNKDLMSYWLPPVIAPRSNATQPGQFSIIMAATLGHESGAIFIFAGKELQLSCTMHNHRIFARLVARARQRLSPSHKTVLMGMWLDVAAETGKTPLEILANPKPQTPSQTGNHKECL